VAAYKDGDIFLAEAVIFQYIRSSGQVLGYFQALAYRLELRFF
jgi:hypothetical protein